MSRTAKRKAPKDGLPAQAQVETASETWHNLPWRKLEQHVYRVQKRIYRASQQGNLRKVHKLEKLLMKSEAARLLAVRRVTQENQGKKTAGVDRVKLVNPKKRLVMAKLIHPKRQNRCKSRPVRRVWIPYVDTFILTCLRTLLNALQCFSGSLTYIVILILKCSQEWLDRWFSNGS